MYQEGDENAVHIFARHLHVKVNVTVFSALTFPDGFLPRKERKERGVT